MPRLPAPEDYGRAAAPQVTRQVVTQRVAPMDRSSELLSRLGAMAMEEADRLDGLAAENALNKLRERRVNLTVNPEEGFQRLQGGAVIERPVLDEFPASFQRSIDDISQGLSAGARKRFQSRASEQMTGFRTDLMRHVAAQTDKFRGDVFAATIEVEANYAASMWGDAVAVDAAVQRAAEAVAPEIERLGFVGEDGAKLREAFIQRQIGTVITGAVRGALDNQSGRRAQEIYDQYEDYLSLSQRQQLGSMIRTATAWEQGQELGQQAFAMLEAGQSMVEIEKFLQSQTGDAKDVYQNATGVYRSLQGARQAQREELGDQALREINNGANWMAIRHRYVGGMSPRAVEAMDRAARAGVGTGGARRTDMGAWYELQQMAVSDDPNVRDRFAQMDLHEHIDYLSDADFKQLAGLQRRLRSGDESEVRDVATFAQQIATARNDVKINTSTPAGKQRAAQLERYIRDEADRRSRELGRNLSYAEREELIAEATTPVSTRGLFGRQQVYRFETDAPATVQEEQGQTTAPASTPANPRRALIESLGPEAQALGMTRNQRTQIISAYQQANRGALPTEEEIVATYRIYFQDQ